MTVELKELLKDFNRRATDRPRSRDLYGNFFKHSLDLLIVLLSLPFMVLIVALLALVILVVDRQGPFYWSERVGRGGAVFRMMKLRTMVRDADARLKEYLGTDPAAATEWAAKQKLTHDPRITRLGGVLRKYSIDELPQLWNVLTGDMSLVGPRPMMPDQRAIYPGNAYYHLRPGITGPWQVSARNLSAFADRAEFDGNYARNLSFGNDLRIVARTFSAVVRVNRPLIGVCRRWMRG